MTHPDDKTPFISNKIHYMSLYEDSDGYFCAGIFFVPKGHALPLHDHTGMLVISKVLRGEVQINSYDKKFPKDTSLTYEFYLL